jgi:hypothetical protein
MKHCKYCNTEILKGRGLKCSTCKNGIDRYGLNRIQQVELLESQNGQCAICKCDITLHIRNNWSGVIDHCHTTNKVRGVLCGYCNTTLGKLEQWMQDDRLKNAQEYLKKFTSV